MTVTAEIRELVADAELVKRLVAAQFPHWADLAIRPVVNGGKNNTTFHLGDAMSVRLPSAKWYVAQVEKEQAWLPRLAPHLPLPIPTPLARGEPGEGYPWPWSIYGWIEGETASPERITDMPRFARSLAAFLKALQAIGASEGPAAGRHNFFRGGPLTTYDEQTREALRALEGRIDTKAATEIWDAAVAATWQGPPVWLHGDVSTGNLLVRDGDLSAVIDFGILGVGDPSSDLVIAWTFFTGQSREAFRASLRLDDATWARARGWALWKALIVHSGIVGGNAYDTEHSPRIIADLLVEHRDGKG